MKDFKQQIARRNKLKETYEREVKGIEDYVRFIFDKYNKDCNRPYLSFEQWRATNDGIEFVYYDDSIDEIPYVYFEDYDKARRADKLKERLKRRESKEAELVAAKAKVKMLEEQLRK